MGKKEVRIWQLYEIKNGKAYLKNRKCVRCGSIMAHHKQPVERWACGKCNYTEYIQNKNSES